MIDTDLRAGKTESYIQPITILLKGVIVEFAFGRLNSLRELKAPAGALKFGIRHSAISQTLIQPMRSIDSTHLRCFQLGVSHIQLLGEGGHSDITPY